MPLPNRSTISTFDGDNKINSPNVPPANQATDWDNTKLAPAISDVAGLGLTAPRFWGILTCGASTGSLSMPAWQAVWKNVTPTVPVLARLGPGLYTITLPTIVSDEYDASLGLSNNITLSLQAAHGTIQNLGGDFGFVSVQASGNVITVNVGNVSGTPSDTVGAGAFPSVLITAY